MIIKADLHCHGPDEWLGTSKWNAMDIAKLVNGKLDLCTIVEMSSGDNRFEELKLNSRAYEKSHGVEIYDDWIVVPEYSLVLNRAFEVPTWSYSDRSDWTKNAGPEGHILAFGAKKRIKEQNLERTLSEAKEQDALVILDHPFAGRYDASAGVLSLNSQETVKKYFERGLVDGVEWNGLLASFDPLSFALGFLGANSGAEVFARSNGYPLVANTDAHSVPEMARAYTCFKIPGEFSPCAYQDAILIAFKNFRLNTVKIEPIKKPAPAFSSCRHALSVLSKFFKR